MSRLLSFARVIQPVVRWASWCVMPCWRSASVQSTQSLRYVRRHLDVMYRMLRPFCKVINVSVVSTCSAHSVLAAPASKRIYKAWYTSSLQTAKKNLPLFMDTPLVVSFGLVFFFYAPSSFRKKTLTVAYLHDISSWRKCKFVHISGLKCSKYLCSTITHDTFLDHKAKYALYTVEAVHTVVHL